MQRSCFFVWKMERSIFGCIHTRNKPGNCSSIPWFKLPLIYWGVCRKRAQGCPALFNFLPSKPFQRLFPKRTFLTWDSFKPRLRASFFLSVLLIYFCFWNIFSKAFLWSSEKTALLNMPLRDLELDSWVRSGSTLSSPSGNRWEIPITSNTFQRNIKCCSL